MVVPCAENKRFLYSSKKMQKFGYLLVIKALDFSGQL